MERIKRLPLSEIPSLTNLQEYGNIWGEEFNQYQKTNRTKGRPFSWRKAINKQLIPQLELQTKGHCSFCDGCPIGTTSREPIEHYFPKAEYPLQAYEWDNLFYCCDKCNGEAARIKFEYTLKPDDDDYDFQDYFYFDPGTGKLLVKENLQVSAPELYGRANLFLERYGINLEKRRSARKNLIFDVQNFLKYPNPKDLRKRGDFAYRYVYDYVERFLLRT